MTLGVLYVATGERYVDEAETSAESLKRATEDLDVTLVTDQDVESRWIDDVVPMDGVEGTLEDKVRYLAESPYDETLFLDTDTYVTGDVTDVFDLLGNFDVAAAHAPVREATMADRDYPVTDVPASFPEYNTGVLAFTASAATDAFFDNWASLYRRQVKNDRLPEEFLATQPAFRKALFGSDIRVATLPPEYNCRFIFPGYVDGEVKILHGRNADYEDLAGKLNADAQPRAHVPGGHWVRVPDRRTVTILRTGDGIVSRVRQAVREKGLRWTLETGLRRIAAVVK